MAIAPIPLLPAAPQRSMGATTYPVVADQWSAAIGPWTVKLNLLVADLNTLSTTLAGYKDSSKANADAAALSASQAAGQVALAAAQVTLATDAKNLAVAARDAAQASAQAAGAAAGLPPQRVPFTVLQVNAAGNVAWGTGLPDTSQALAGQALVLGANKVPGWGYAGTQIGDVLYTARNPGAGYVPAAGGVYLQSAFPAYFALIGLIGGQRAVSFTAKSLTPPLVEMGFGDNGVVLGVSITAGTVGFVYKSTDYGNTFAQVGNINDTSGILQVLHLGGANWMIGTNSSKLCFTPDNGATFTSLNVAGSFFRAATDKAGTIIVCTSTTTLRSINNGQSFSALPFGNVCNNFVYAGSGRWVGITSGSTTICYVSDDAFTNGAARSFNGTLGGAPAFIDADQNTGVIVIAGSNGGATNLNLAVSFDRGESFGLAAAGSAGTPRSVVNAGNDTWLVSCVQTASVYDIRKSSNGAKSFVAGPAPGTSAAPIRLIADPLKGQVIANTTATAGAGSYAVSAPVLGYDATTQFKVPTLSKQEGVTPYVRAA